MWHVFSNRKWVKTTWKDVCIRSTFTYMYCNLLVSSYSWWKLPSRLTSPGDIWQPSLHYMIKVTCHDVLSVSILNNLHVIDTVVDKWHFYGTVYVGRYCKNISPVCYSMRRFHITLTTLSIMSCYKASQFELRIAVWKHTIVSLFSFNERKISYQLKGIQMV